MVALLDVNVLLALVDRLHVYHEIAHGWFAVRREQGWATCPITENGAVRILSQPRYPNGVDSPAVAIRVFSALRSHQAHHFWPDSISLLSEGTVTQSRLASPNHVTDAYLVALAKANDGVLATFDRKLAVVPVDDAARFIELIG